MRRIAMIGLIALTALALGCATSRNPRQERVVGTFADAGGRGPIRIPDVVSAGEPFTVTVLTAGGGCVSMGDTEIEGIGPRVARVTPYDVRVVGEDIACTQEFRLLEHAATLRFDEPGTARVLVVGRERRDAVPVTVERTVVVR